MAVSGLYPASGVPAEDAKNTLPNPNNAPGCEDLWYSTARCQPRFDPAAANAMLAEVINLINQAQLAYNCTSLSDVQLAVRRLIQRGLPQFNVCTGGPNNYFSAPDPAVTHYNNGLVVCVHLPISIAGPMTLNVNGLGEVRVLRNDGQELHAYDLFANVPYLLCFLNGAFFVLFPVYSQFPNVVASGSADLWIRTDGDDSHDGSANTPDKAFKTINGAWLAAGSRFISTPLFTINLRLGIPGVYVGTNIGPFGGRITLTGDKNDKWNYRVSQFGSGAFFRNGIGALDCNLTLSGITIHMDQNVGSLSAGGVVCNGAQVTLDDMAFDLVTNNGNGNFIGILQGGVSASPTTIDFRGNGGTIAQVIWANHGSVFSGMGDPGVTGNFNFSNINCSDCFQLSQNLSLISWRFCFMNATGITGKQYRVDNNAIIEMNGHPPPGTVAGTTATGGQFVP